jgi:molybdopterin-synthase adenylyltransferase
VRVTAIVDDVNHEQHRAVRGRRGRDRRRARQLRDALSRERFRGQTRHPYVYGGAVGTAGAALAILPHTARRNAPGRPAGGNRATPCLRCLFEEAPPPGTMPTCDTAGVIGPAVTMIASFQAAEALKILTGNFDRVNARRC